MTRILIDCTQPADNAEVKQKYKVRGFPTILFLDVDGNPLVYDQPDLYNRRGLVASNGPLHDFVIETLRPIVAPAS